MHNTNTCIIHEYNTTSKSKATNVQYTEYSTVEYTHVLLGLELRALALRRLALAHDRLRLLDAPIVAQLLHLREHLLDAVRQRLDAVRVGGRGEQRGQVVLGVELEPRVPAPDLPLHVRDEVRAVAVQVVLVAHALEASTRAVLLEQLVVVQVGTRAEVDARVGKEVVRTETCEVVLADLVVAPMCSSHSLIGTCVSVLSHQFVQQSFLRGKRHLNMASH